MPFNAGLRIDGFANDLYLELGGVLRIEIGQINPGPTLDQFKIIGCELGGSEIKDDRRFLSRRRGRFGDLWLGLNAARRCDLWGCDGGGRRSEVGNARRSGVWGGGNCHVRSQKDAGQE